MYIVIFIRQLSVGGAEKQSLLLTRELQKLHQTCLVVWTRKILASHYEDFIVRNNLNVVFLEGTVISKMFKLWQFFRSRRVTHVFNFLLINNFMGGFMGRLAGVKHIYGGIRNCEIVRSKLWWQKFLHNHVSHKTIFNNHSGVVKLTSKGFNTKKMLVIHNGIDLDERPEPERDNEKTIIFTAARFLPQKDHFTALKAIQLLKKEGRKFVYVLSGYGPQEIEIGKWIKDFDLQDYVEMKIAPLNLPELFRRADIYLSTSLKEGLSNSIMEALNAWLPVVATDAGDNKYLVREGENGFLAQAGDSVMLANCLKKLLGDPELRTAMGRKGYDHLKNRFSTRHFLNQYLELLSDE